MNLTLLSYLLKKLGVVTTQLGTTALAANRALTAADNRAKLSWQSAAADCALTVPADLPDGFKVRLYQLDAHPITFTAGAGATIRNVSNYTKTGGQWSTMTLRKVAAATYVLSGSGAV